MTNTTFSRIATAVLFAVTIQLGACKQGDKPEDALAQDTSLAHDLSLANADTMSQPQLKDVPVTTAPIIKPAAAASRVAQRQTPSQILTPSRNPRRVATTTRTTPQPVEKAPAVTENGNTVTVTESAGTGSTRGMGTIASGSEISLYSGQRVCTNTYAVGDRFTASVAESVQGSNGVAIPAGATAVIELTSLKRSENANDNITMEFVVRSIAFNGTTYPVNSTVTTAQVEKVRNGDASNDVKKVATGAIIGAIAGQIFGHHTKSTVIGAATGAAAGAVVAGATGKYDGCVPNGGRISLRLTQPMLVQQSV
ncbi:MAG: YMGG-like glycine zipper-containing protein [Gemmatimonadota bacterium]|nr:YMGG-like glycine zipper-containing protein [Gemmatimonadota bacterium]MDQ6872535.1 YMGG-like glycine zipper-containing protein [Gemmatimonadota bacterium]